MGHRNGSFVAVINFISFISAVVNLRSTDSHGVIGRIFGDPPPADGLGE